MRVGFIGVGYMGRHMARNIARGRHQLTVFDIRRSAADEHVAAGATWAGSPGAVAEATDVVFTSLPRPSDVEEVATGEGGILSGAAPGTAYFDLSTTDPATMHRIAEAARSREVAVLDARNCSELVRRMPPEHGVRPCSKLSALLVTLLVEKISRSLNSHLHPLATDSRLSIVLIAAFALSAADILPDH